MKRTTMCPCGRPLHYANPDSERIMDRLVAELGEDIRITYLGHDYMVSRHYIALHGVIAKELLELAERGIARPVAPDFKKKLSTWGRVR